MFSELKHGLGDIPDRNLWCWDIPGAQEICNFVWDTRVPEVTDPWPTIPFESIEAAVASLSPRTTAVLKQDTMLLEVIS